MERIGTGIKRIKKACSLNKNKVEFDFSDSFWVKIYSMDEPLNGPLNGPLNEPLNGPLNVFNFIKNNPGCKRNDIVKGTGLSLAKVKRILASSNSIERKGSDKTGGYYLKK
jgi:predicted HTH transcriptional regulator